jgi:hypothetical protein
MAQAKGTGHGRREAQVDHLARAIPDESALVRLPSRYTHRCPSRRAHELDLQVRMNPALLKLATDPSANTEPLGGTTPPARARDLTVPAQERRPA